MIMKNIYWLAGLLGGEGAFVIRQDTNIELYLSMTDKDIVQKVATLLNVNCNYKTRGKQDQLGRKQAYCCSAVGRRAAAWMMTLHPLLGERRKIQIRKALESWKKLPGNNLQYRMKLAKNGPARGAIQ